MWTREKAMKFRKIIEKAAISLADADASIGPEMFPRLKGDGSLIEHGTRICWQNADGSLCIKRAAVDLWDTAENTLDAAPTLWEDIAYHDGIRIIPETITSTLAFSKDELGYWAKTDTVYRSKQDGNVWTPEQYADAWEVYTGE